MQVTTLNPEAGYHAIPTDPLEVDIALRAGAIAWAKFPYLLVRFGERGKRFTTSDSCWLVTLFSIDESAASKSIYWLRRVLATRGIPSVILESHLLQICREFEKTFPERTRQAEGIRRIANSLGSVREQQTELIIADAELIAELRTLDRFKNMPMFSLLISAAADERDGIGGAFTNVKNWLVNHRD